MPVDEPRTAFDPASRRPSNPAEESGSPPPSGKRQIGESRGEAAWRHPHQGKELFAHIDDRQGGIMMSMLMTRLGPRSIKSGPCNSDKNRTNLLVAFRGRSDTALVWMFIVVRMCA
jgi:hypothetical protein